MEKTGMRDGFESDLIQPTGAKGDSLAFSSCCSLWALVTVPKTSFCPLCGNIPRSIHVG